MFESEVSKASFQKRNHVDENGWIGNQSTGLFESRERRTSVNGTLEDGPGFDGLPWWKEWEVVVRLIGAPEGLVLILKNSGDA